MEVSVDCWVLFNIAKALPLELLGSEQVPVTLEEDQLLKQC